LEGKALIDFMTGIFSSQEKSTFRIASKSTAFERRRMSQIYNILGLRPRPLDFTIRATETHDHQDFIEDLIR